MYFNLYDIVMMINNPHLFFVLLDIYTVVDDEATFSFHRVQHVVVLFENYYTILCNVWLLT